MGTLLALVCPAGAVRAGWLRPPVGHRSWAPGNDRPASFTVPPRSTPVPSTGPDRPVPDPLAPTGADLDDWPGRSDPGWWPGFDPLRAA